jgi:hypothetical protein
MFLIHITIPFLAQLPDDYTDCAATRAGEQLYQTKLNSSKSICGNIPAGLVSSDACLTKVPIEFVEQPTELEGDDERRTAFLLWSSARALVHSGRIA